MAVLTFTEIQNIALDRAQANVATDGPFSAAEIARHINEAYADIYEIEGGAIKNVSHNSLWGATGDGIDGQYSSVLYDIGEILNVVAAIADNTVVGKSTDRRMDRTDLSEIQALRMLGAALGTYALPVKYSVTRENTVQPTTLPSVRLDVWPHVASIFFPTEYILQFTPIDAVTVTRPNVSDIGSRDIALLTAMRWAPLNGRAEFVPSIASDVSDRTKAALERKFSAMLDARQDR